MMGCNAIPYNGHDSYTSFIGAFSDDTIAWPLIERLARKGLRVWHDADVRNPQISYMESCLMKGTASSAFIILLSESALCSHIFRERFTRIIETKKTVVVICVNQPVLTMGVKFQLEKAVAVISCAAIPDDQVIDSVIKTGELKACIGFPNQSINVQPYALPSIQPLPKPQPLIICSPTDQTISELEKIGNQPSSVSASCVSGSSAPEQSKQTKTVNQAPADKNKKEKMIFSVSSAAQPNVPNSYFEETLKSTSNQQTPEENDNENTLVPQKSQLPVIMSLTSGEKNGD